MKKKLIVQSMALLVVIAGLLIVLSSCTKSAEGNLTKEQKEKQDSTLSASSVSDTSLIESDEDLMTVDYKEFYEQLEPYGDWVQVKPEDVGLKSNPTASLNTTKSSFSFASLLGVNTAYANTDANTGLIFVWKPSPNLAVTTINDEPVYRPYSNGNWVNSDAGWYFRGNTPVEETVSHQGRWVNTANDGWIWVPGRVWAPAWVDMRQNDQYESWAPLPPSVYLSNGMVSSPVIDNNNYMTVERKYFLEPDVYRYDRQYYDNGDRIVVSEMQVLPGLFVVNNVLVNRGPELSIFQTLLGVPIQTVSIQHVTYFNEVRYLDNQYWVYTPKFKRNGHDNRREFSRYEPKNYVRYDDYRNEREEKDKREKFNGNDKENRQKINKDNGHKDQGYDNGNKNRGNDNGNGNKNKGYDNGNKNRGNDNGNGNKNKGYDNGNKNKGNDNSNGNKNKGNDNGNGNKNKGNDNGNGNKDKGNSNDHGNKDKGNGNDHGNKDNGNGNDHGNNDKGNGNDHGKGKNNSSKII